GAQRAAPRRPTRAAPRAAGAALSDLWDEAVMRGAATRADATLAATVEGETDPLVDIVGRDPEALGLTALGERPALKPLAVSGIAATDESLKSGRFPLSRALYL